MGPSLPAHGEIPVSESGWRTFLAAGLDDWVVLAGGATAVFRVSSLHDATELVAALADIPGLEENRTLMVVARDVVTVRLTRGVFRLEPRHAELARAVSEVARSRGASADRSAVNDVALAISAKPDAIDLPFWRAVLGYDPLADDNAVDPLGHGSTVWMQELNPDKPLRHAMHIDVSVAKEQVDDRVAAALAAGGRVVDDANAPGAWLLADRSGNKVDVIAWPDGAPGMPDLQ